MKIHHFSYFFFALLLLVVCIPAKADTEVKQVEIEARLAEVKDSFVRDIGVNFDGLGADHHQGKEIENLPIDASRGIDHAGAASGGVSNNATFGDLAGINPNGMLQALETEGKERVIEPKLVEIDSKTVESIAPNLKLQFTPQITPNGNVVMDVQPQTEQITPPPVTETKIVKTSFILFAGPTAVLGGLQGNEDKSGNSGVPFLGQIPILGHLFGNANRDQKTELPVFVTPSIIKPE